MRKMLEAQAKGLKPLTGPTDVSGRWRILPHLVVDDLTLPQCDKSLPACSACINVGHECIPRKIDVEPITNTGGNLSHSALPSYVETLKRKRESLQIQLRRQRPRYASNAENTAESDIPQVQPSRDGGDEGEHETTEHTVEAAMGEIGFLSRSAMAEPRDGRGEAPQELAMGRMVRAALAITGANPSESRIDALQQAVGGMTDQPFSLKKHLASPFVSRFLQAAGARFLHIDSANIWADFETFFAEPGLSNNQADLSNPARSFNVYLSIATGMLISPQSSNFQGLSSSIHAAAVKLLGTIIQSESTEKILSCMILMILYSVYGSLGGSTWHLIGLAMKRAIASRFHRDPDRGTVDSSEALTKRRNIFWSLYTLDRDISAIMDRPFSIEDEDITVMPPDEYLANTSDEQSLAFHTVTHARLISSTSPIGKILHEIKIQVHL
ncbi:hypothetical protein N7509_003386 [Penicillium cosmopolitanum]|uniref:Xylanolytic transcriptional activator regulatory domain-containing protein n=1 Tax=Penicillium cosmopolitanum TaxID=1131564 RepID=A0A9W9W4X2_9EURO|nr:uncharacterized protein N7509_003386 [Penicillium cosmopolitanum]KAJ5403515.1 hypothetical protein N7509_003386 [Penicillium cosmopolitanum]